MAAPLVARTSQPTTEAASRAEVRAVARRTLPPAPVATPTLLAQPPDISMGPRDCSGELLRLCNTHLIGVPWDLVEVPVDDVAGRPGERGCPVAEELGDDGERRGRDCSGARQPLDGCAVCGLRG